MLNHLVLAGGLLLSSCVPIEAQITATQIVLAQTSPDLTMIRFLGTASPFIAIRPANSAARNNTSTSRIPSGRDI